MIPIRQGHGDEHDLHAREDERIVTSRFRMDVVRADQSFVNRIQLKFQPPVGA